MIAAEDIRIPLLTDTAVEPGTGALASASSYPGLEPVRSGLPEPATIMLFGTVAWLVGSRLRRNGRDTATASVHRSPASGEQADNARVHDRAAETDEECA
jgi:hypothetical protein